MIAAIVVGLGMIFVLANQNNLLSDTFRLRASFNRVSGLQNGATVFYNGISVGRVEAVRLPSGPGQPITVEMAIREDARELIRADSRAVIQTDGLVGNVIVAITGGTAIQPPVADGGQVPGVDPLDLSQFSSKAIESVARLDSVTIALAGIMTDVRSGEGTVGRFLYDEALYDETVLTTREFRTLLGTFGQRADNLTLIAEDASRGVEQILAKVNTGNGTVARFLNEDDVYTTFLATATQLQGAAAQFQTVSADVRAITDRFEQAAGWGALGAFRFSENMEALKHNFLFKSYFEDRGYFEMAPFEVREQAISETLTDLQEWERRLYRQQQEIDAQQQEIERIRQEAGRLNSDASPTLPLSPLGPTGAGGPDADRGPSAGDRPGPLFYSP